MKRKSIKSNNNRKSKKKSKTSNSTSRKRKRTSTSTPIENESIVSSISSLSNEETPNVNVGPFRGLRFADGQQEHFANLDRIARVVEEGTRTPIGYNQERSSMIMPSTGSTPPPRPRPPRLINRRNRNTGIVMPRPLRLSPAEISPTNIIDSMRRLNLADSTRNASRRHSRYNVPKQRNKGGKNKTKKHRKKFVKNT
jgi:hypothetical protein